MDVSRGVNEDGHPVESLVVFSSPPEQPDPDASPAEPVFVGEEGPELVDPDRLAELAEQSGGAATQARTVLSSKARSKATKTPPAGDAP